MKGLCHYTSIDSLLEIISSDEVNIIATYYKQYGKDDYSWIRERGKRIVKELCVEHNWKYDPGDLAYNPYIISFCTNANSYYMWNKFKGEGTEAMISLDPCLFLNSISIYRLESLVPCKYVSPNATDVEIKNAVLDIISNECFENLEKGELLKLAIMGVMQGKFWDEEEIRYVKLCSLYARVNPANDGPQVIKCEDIEQDNFIRIPFPKGIINSVCLRNDISDEDYEDVLNHIVKCGYSPEIISKQK